MTNDDRDLIAAVDATLAELREAGASDDDLAEFAEHVIDGLHALAAEGFATGAEVPPWLPREFHSLDVAESDTATCIEWWTVGDRTAIRTGRYGDPAARHVLRFAD